MRSPLYYILLNRLYNDTFIIISFTIFWNVVAEVYSPNILFMDESADSAIHLCPYFLFHFNRSLVCTLDSLFLNLLFLGETIEFLLTFIAWVIFFSWRYLKLVFVSWAPTAKTDFRFLTLFFPSWIWSIEERWSYPHKHSWWFVGWD